MNVRWVLAWKTLLVRVVGGGASSFVVFFSFEFPFHRACEELGMAVDALDRGHFALVAAAEHRVLELVLCIHTHGGESRSTEEKGVRNVKRNEDCGVCEVCSETQ